jgi:phage recombination protein Bet
MAATAPAAGPEQGLVTSSVDPEVAAAIQLYDRLAPLKNALGIGDLSVPEIQLFAMVAHRTGLDPFTRQIYAIKRAGKVTHQTGIDGYRSVAERTSQYLGSDEPTYEPCTCKAKPEGHPAVARVTVHRAHQSGNVINQVGVARWHELVPPSGQDSMWQKMPFNQLAKCAEAAGLRKAFPRVLGGVFINEEMEQAGPPEDGALVEAAAKPTAGERIAARRAAIEQIVEHEPASDAPGADEDAGTPTDTTPTEDAAAGPDAGADAQESEPAGLTQKEFMARAQALGVSGKEAVEAAKALWPEYDPPTSPGLTPEQRAELIAALEEKKAEEAL